MRRWRVKISEPDFLQLRQLVLSDLPLEAGAFALAGLSKLQQSTDILLRRVVAIPHDQLIEQLEYHLELSPRAINGLVSLCEASGLLPVLCHSHGNESPYSPSDDHGEERIFHLMRACLPTSLPMLSLLISPTSITGRVWDSPGNRPEPVEEIIILGHAIKRIPLCQRNDRGEEPIQPLYDRQVRAFGLDGQRRIQQAKVGIVGAGATGSSVAEQLIRLGVQDLVIVDRDPLDETNITRVYGSFAHSLTRKWWSRKPPPLKVDVLAQHLRAIQPSARVRAVPEKVSVPGTTHMLLDRDVIFLCTDDHWGRAEVNAVAYRYMIPTLNIGAQIGNKGGRITGVVGVVDVLRPDKPCLWCKQFLRPERIAAESLPQADRIARQKEHYAEDIDTPAPSVVSLTTTVAAIAVTQFLHLVTGFMGPQGDVARLNYSGLQQQLSRGTTTISAKCVCTNVKAYGDLQLP